MHFTFINYSISKFLLISDHISLGKDEFRDKTACGVSRIVYMIELKLIWNAQSQQI